MDADTEIRDQRRESRAIGMLKLGAVALSFAMLLGMAHAAAFTCRGKFKPGDCFCTEIMSPKSTLGYNPAPDEQGVEVKITCVNHDTREISYYTAEKQLFTNYGGLGATYSPDRRRTNDLPLGQ